MPSIPDEYVPFRVNLPQPDKPPVQSPDLLATVRAAGVVANWPYRSVRYLDNRDGVDTDPDHDPFAAIEGTKYASDPEQFAFSRNAEETEAIKREWDEDEQAREVLSRSGTSGTVAMVGMGLLDPTIFLPVAKVFSGVATGANVLRIAGDVALASGVGAAVGETAMAATTPHYGAGDVAVGIGSATLLGGLLGAGAGALLSRGERRALADSLDADRKAWGDDVAAAAPASPAPNAAGAAAADTRELQLRTPSILKHLPDPTGKVSPPRRVLNSGLTSARRAVVDLVETPYIFEDNVEGIATTQGPSLDRLAKLETGKARVAVTRQFEQAYTKYRFGTGQDPNLRQRIANRATRLMDHTGRPREKASFAEFRAMVDDAMRNNDEHAIPEVAETAKMIRDTVIAPWRDRAIKAGLLPDGVEAKTADSYMMRVWNKEKLIGERPRALKIIGDWLEGEEAKKAALQDTMRGLQGQIDEAAAKLEKLQSNRNKQLGKNADAIDAEMADIEAAQLAARTRLEEAIAKWEGKSAKEAKSALKARGKADEARGGRGERLTGADRTVDATVRALLAKERLRTRAEVDGLAQEIIDRIVGNPDGRMPYDAHAASQGAGDSKRGPLAARDFMIPDALVRDFIDTDAHNTAELYLNTMVPDVLLTERFGDVDMTETFRRMKDESAAQQVAAATPAERLRLKAEYDSAVADIAAMRDRVRHTYGYSSDPRQRFLGRMAVTASRYDILTNLGGATLSSLSDLAGVQWRYGLASTFRNAWLPFFKALTSKESRAALMAQKRQLQTLGIAAETYLASRASGIYDVLDVYRPTSRFERGMKVAADKFGLFNVLSPWTDFGRLAAGMVSSTELSRAAVKLSQGKASGRQIRDLAENGIDAAMASRIAKQIEREGGADVVRDSRIPNTGAWNDAGAREAFEGALARDLDLMIITPGAEKPLMMSKPIAALILQYKSFVAAANERLLVRSLQARDRQVLQGMVSAIGLGILAEYAYSSIVGRDMATEPADLVKAGVTRAGLLGWYQEANAISSKWTGGTADIFRAIGAERPDSRYISRSKLGAILGPTSNKLESLISTGSDIANLNWTAADTRRMRRMLIGQNLFYIRGLLDKLEEGVNGSLGVEPFEE